MASGPASPTPRHARRTSLHRVAVGADAARKSIALVPAQSEPMAPPVRDVPRGWREPLGLR